MKRIVIVKLENSKFYTKIKINKPLNTLHMKKRNINSLKLNKTNISSLKGGFGSPIESDCTSLGNGDPCPKSHDCENDRY